MFNNYMWQTYLKAGGNEIVSLFENTLLNGIFDNYTESISKLHKAYNPSKVIIEELKNELDETFNIAQNGVFVFAPGEYTIESAIEFLYNEFTKESNSTPQIAFDEFSSSIAYFSTLCACELPELFVPYYFKYNFNILEKIANKFGFELPKLPVKKDYKGRFFYYAKLCEVFYDFRTERNMTPYEFCAFLYDFAPKYIGGIDSYIIKDLPQAKSAYFIGGTKDDAFLSNEEDIITPWQCSPETLAGDNIVMYLKSPISAVDSIWRSVSIGFNDPFFYYYRCTYIAKPHKITHISQKQLEKDQFFKELPIVKKNMQGLNGVELYPSAYNHLLDLSKTDLPKLEFLSNNDKYDLFREKDVEDKLIKPFLEKLGYTQNEYVQQLYIEIGNRNHALIPDFVVHPKISKGHQSAEFLVEAKYSVKSGKDLEEYKKQSRSYANQLKAKYSVIASREGIWLSSEIDDFSRDFIVLSWSELNKEDNFYKVLKFIGNGNVIKSANTQKKLAARASEFIMFSED